MADLRRKRKQYPSTLPDANVKLLRNEPPGYHFRIGDLVVDFRPYIRKPQKSLDVAWHLAIAIWRRRGVTRRATIEGNYGAALRFLEYVDGISGRPSITAVDRRLLASFVFWAKNIADRRDGTGKVTPTTGVRWWRSIAALFNELRKDKALKLSPSLRLPVVKSVPDKPVAPYSRTERDRILRAAYREIEARKKTRTFADVVRHSDLVPYALILAIRTGLNPSVLLELGDNPVRPSQIKGLAWLRTGIKHRSGAGHTHPAVTPEADEDAPLIRMREAELIDEVRTLTSSLRAVAPEDLKSELWLIGSAVHAKSTGSRTKMRRMSTSGGLYPALQSLVDRYELKTDDGHRLSLTFQRCRPTFAEEYLRANGGDLVDLQRRLGQRSLKSTTRYVDLKAADRRRSFRFAGLVLQSLSLGDESLPTDDELVSGHHLTPEEIAKLRSGENNVALARCRDPFNSPLRSVLSGEVCAEFMACLKCPNMVVIRDDLYRLFSFYWYIDDKRSLIGRAAWTENYSWIIETIDNEIATRFADTDAVAAAKTRAQTNPHPLWTIDHEER